MTGNTHLIKADEIFSAFSTHIRHVCNIIHFDVVQSAFSHRNDTSPPAFVKIGDVCEVFRGLRQTKPVGWMVSVALL